MIRYIDSNGVERVCGGADLKRSQHYPERFGAAVMEVYMMHHEEVKKAVKDNKKDLEENPRKELKERKWKNNQ